ncbi:hypothetical protein [Maribacter halichondriae]|nr:hypothetical protein [Maribacter sp. Hal144]
MEKIHGEWKIAGMQTTIYRFVKMRNEKISCQQWLKFTNEKVALT